MPTPEPYGAWESPIAAALVAAGELPLRQPSVAGASVYWLEGRPLEHGRLTLMRYTDDGRRSELTAAPLDVRTRAHEYGGGAYVVHGSTVFFSNFTDQRLYRVDADGRCTPLTPVSAVPGGDRFADAVVTSDGRLLFCIRERHARDRREAVNEIVVVCTDGSAPPVVVISGHDFFAAPRLSPDGCRLAWQAWNHPRMPWDGCELWIGDVADDGTVRGARSVAGGAEESICQPEWSPDGTLHWVSDRSGWWNLMRLGGDTPEPIAAMDADFGVPQWLFGCSTYAFLGDERIACIYTRDGIDRLALVRPGRPIEDIDLPFTAIAPTLRASGRTLVFIASSPSRPAGVIRMDATTGEWQVIRRSIDRELEPATISAPRPIVFPTARDLEAHALYYPPTSAVTGMPDERPPLLVQIHGGPTARASAQFALGTQFWTTRGFGVVDVNYGGSSGYGRRYRQRLNGQWGIVDVEDCLNAARFLAERGEVDGRRMAIRGGSAGGYTALCALVDSDVFAAAASYYGIGDCETLARETHKFESHYLETLIGPYPETRDVYRRRSPIHHIDRVSCPVILFHGRDDRVVPLSQGEAIAAALRARGVPFAFLSFEGEAHGFRQAETIRRALEAELYFYSRVFGFPLPQPLDPIDIENAILLRT